YLPESDYYQPVVLLLYYVYGREFCYGWPEKDALVIRKHLLREKSKKTVQPPGGLFGRGGACQTN
ncbi:MAG: hypothetical protein NTW99_09535, partial [Chloroflexi bacterium]|nr:hypothetical protein [Chloroflexota bacterium]